MVAVLESLHTTTYKITLNVTLEKFIRYLADEVEHEGFQEDGWSADEVIGMYKRLPHTLTKLRTQFCYNELGGHQVLPIHCSHFLEHSWRLDTEEDTETEKSSSQGRPTLDRCVRSYGTLMTVCRPQPITFTTAHRPWQPDPSASCYKPLS